VTRRERLSATFAGRPVDRVPVSYYELWGVNYDTEDPDRFNTYNSPSWHELKAMIEEHCDLMVWRYPSVTPAVPELHAEIISAHAWEEGDSRFTTSTMTVGGRALTTRWRRDKDVATTWTLQHPLKDTDDIEAYLSLPDEFFDVNIDTSPLVGEDERIGDRGLVMFPLLDVLCATCNLFSMEDYGVVAFTEPELFHRLMERHSHALYKQVEQVCMDFPGHVWWIAGSEYASEPYLPPSLFSEFAIRYLKPIVDTIHKYDGYARVHCHGRVRTILPKLIEIGVDAIDPMEPPHLGDITLEEARRLYGKDIVLIGDLEIRDIEMMEPGEFEKVVEKSLVMGTSGSGRGFILMPGSGPYGRNLSDRCLMNSETFMRMARDYRL